MKANPELLAALAAYRAHRGAQQEWLVLKTLMDSQPLFLTAEPPVDGRAPRLAFGRDRHNRSVLLAFSDERAVTAFEPAGGEVVSAPAAGFVPAVVEGPFEALALNPGSATGVLVPKNSVALLAAGALPEEAGQGYGLEPWS